MEISAGSGGESRQRYWMEITDRDLHGSELTAPKLNSKQKPYWSYDAVTQVRPGDVIFHWHKTLARKPAIVGWSRAIGPLYESTMSWTSPGAKGTKMHYHDVPNWNMPLGSLHLLDSPVMSAQLQDISSKIMSQITEKYGPFYIYGQVQLRAQQAYLTNFPADLIPIIESVSSLELELSSEADDYSLPSENMADHRTGHGQGWLRDQKLKVAIEQHAVETAIQYYNEMGASEVVVLGKPYDLGLTLAGKARRIEVKGSSVSVDSVLLTRNEVIHAREFEHMDLVVVDEIRFAAHGDGEYRTTGGRVRVWTGWNPLESSLTAMAFKHQLGSTEIGA